MDRMRRERKFVRSFAATDGTGKQYTLEVYAQLRYTTWLDGQEGVIKGREEVQTEDGAAAHPLGGGKFEVIGRGLILHGTDPTSP